MLRSALLAAALLLGSGGPADAEIIVLIHRTPWWLRAAPEWRTYGIGREIYRESPEESAARLRAAEKACQGTILYTRPENAPRAAAVARRCGGKIQ